MNYHLVASNYCFYIIFSCHLNQTRKNIFFKLNLFAHNDKQFTLIIENSALNHTEML